MSLDHAILGFLNHRPFSGYDLKKIFDATVQHFWPADQSQIYRTLARLAAEGCVKPQRIDQANRPDRKLYHITKAGRRTLMQWLASPPPMGTARRAALVQVFFLGQLGDEEILARFESVAALMRETLKAYEQLPETIAAYADQIGSPRETFFWLSTLDLGMRTMRANVEWAESMISQIRKRKVPRKQAAGPREPRVRWRRAGHP